jgi:hypothetical protein
VTSSSDGLTASWALRPAIVLSGAEESCVVVDDRGTRPVAFAAPFPRPRGERVLPGHLVALVDTPGGSELVAWRWFDAVVVSRTGPNVALWEPLHGSVLALPRDARRSYRAGGRAYVSAGLPGAHWWLAGPAVDRAEDSDVELDEVGDFYTAHDLWDQLI